jgi:hypothetical protein
VVFDSEGYRGLQSRKIEIHSNDSRTPVEKYSFTAFVLATRASGPKINIGPPAIDFGKVKTGEKKVASLIVNNSGVGILKIKNLVLSHSAFDAEITNKEIGSQKVAIVNVKLDSFGLRGLIEGNLKLHSNDNSRRKIIIPLKVFID